jgi:hypothetical protein
VAAGAENPNPASGRLSDYATPEETAALVVALKAEWRTQDERMREAKIRIGPLARRPGETSAAYERRCLAMTKTDQERVDQVEGLRLEQHTINIVLDEVARNVIPWRDAGCLVVRVPLFAAILASYEAACIVADEAWHREVAATPVDDAAWEQELERRRNAAWTRLGV